MNHKRTSCFGRAAHLRNGKLERASAARTPPPWEKCTHGGLPSEQRPAAVGPPGPDVANQAQPAEIDFPRMWIPCLGQPLKAARPLQQRPPTPSTASGNSTPRGPGPQRQSGHVLGSLQQGRTGNPQNPTPRGLPRDPPPPAAPQRLQRQSWSSQSVATSKRARNASHQALLNTEPTPS